MTKFTCRLLKQNKGVSALEIVIVVITFAAIAAIAVPSYYKLSNKTQVIEVKAYFQKIQKSLQLKDNEQFPIVAFNAVPAFCGATPDAEECKAKIGGNVLLNNCSAWSSVGKTGEKFSVSGTADLSICEIIGLGFTGKEKYNYHYISDGAKWVILATSKLPLKGSQDYDFWRINSKNSLCSIYGVESPAKNKSCPQWEQLKVNVSDAAPEFTSED